MKKSFGKMVAAALLLAASALTTTAYAAAPPVNLSPPPAQEAKQLNSTVHDRAADFNYTLTKGESPPAVVMCDNTVKGVMLGVAAKKCALKADIGPSIANPAFAAKFEPAWRQPAFALNIDVGDGVIRTFDNSSDTLRGTGKAFAIAAASRNWPVSLGFA